MKVNKIIDGVKICYQIWLLCLASMQSSSLTFIDKMTIETIQQTELPTTDPQTDLQVIAHYIQPNQGITISHLFVPCFVPQTLELDSLINPIHSVMLFNYYEFHFLVCMVHV